MDVGDWLNLGFWAGVIGPTVKLIFHLFQHRRSGRWIERANPGCEGVNSKTRKPCNNLGKIEVKGFWVCESHAKRFGKELEVEREESDGSVSIYQFSSAKRGLYNELTRK